MRHLAAREGYGVLRREGGFQTRPYKTVVQTPCSNKMAGE